MSPWEIIGTVLGVIGVALMIRQHVWTWPVGLVQVSVSGWVFYQAKLYSDALLQIFFFGIQVYGWCHWLHARERAKPELPVTRLPMPRRLGWIAAGIVGTFAWGELMRRNTDAALPYWDAFILVFSLIAQWFQARKYLENWAGWMIVNGVAIGVFWVKELRLYSVLYVIFFVMAMFGHRAWQRSLRQHAHP